MRIIKDVDPIWRTDDYDVVLVGTNVYALLSNGFQSKIRFKYPRVAKANDSTPYGDMRKIGTNLRVDGTPTICLMYILGYPDTVRECLNYEGLERCLRLAEAEFRGMRLMTTVPGSTAFDGNGNKERIVKLMGDIFSETDIDVYDYIQIPRAEESKMVIRRLDEEGITGKGNILKQLYLD